jgi:hypothetical protein
MSVKTLLPEWAKTRKIVCAGQILEALANVVPGEIDLGRCFLDPCTRFS